MDGDNIIHLQERRNARLTIHDAGDDVGLPPPRGWLLENQFCREFVSSVVGAGQAGKTALRIAQLLSAATLRPLTGQHVFVRCRVLLVSLEDNVDEIQRRIAAAVLHHNISRANLKDWFFYTTPPKGIKLAELINGSRQRGDLELALRDAIMELKPDIVCLDPFVKTHALVENDNGAMDYVCDLLAGFADEFKIAVDTPHHTRRALPRLATPTWGAAPAASRMPAA